MSTRSTYDPFGWRLEELARPVLNPLRRAELLDDLLIVEAEELAMGRRHLTIIHGEPTDLAEAVELNEFYDTISDVAKEADWSRLSAGLDHLTINVAGECSQELLVRVTDLALILSRGRWLITDLPHAPCQRPKTTG